MRFPKDKEGDIAMKVKRLLFVIMSVSLMLAPSAFARQGQDPGASVRFQQALEQDGSDVPPGGVAAAVVRRPASSRENIAEPVPDPFTEDLIADLAAGGFPTSKGPRTSTRPRWATPANFRALLQRRLRRPRKRTRRAGELHPDQRDVHPGRPGPAGDDHLSVCAITSPPARPARPGFHPYC